MNRAVNSYLDDSRSHTSLVAAALNGRFVIASGMMLALLVALVAVGGAIAISSQAKLEPYVFVVEKATGLTWTLGHAARLNESADEVRHRVDEASISNFFTWQRSVTPDAWKQTQDINAAYSMIDINDPAKGQLDTWYQSQDVFARASEVMVHAEPISTMPLTKQTWQVDWHEIVTNRQTGLRIDDRRMRATAEVYHREATNETLPSALHDNPAGLYVRDFHIIQLESQP